ncbi:exported hypothetical protein [Agrobacterium fabacearum CFBP 5771]|nr:exported hypothetical protein [Agrobacterium fabacearum CFBP 5771]
MGISLNASLNAPLPVQLLTMLRAHAARTPSLAKMGKPACLLATGLHPRGYNAGFHHQAYGKCHSGHAFRRAYCISHFQACRRPGRADGGGADVAGRSRRLA